MAEPFRYLKQKGCERSSPDNAVRASTLITDTAMLKYLPLMIGSLAIGALVVAFAVGCSSEPTEEPVDGPQPEDAQACSPTAEPSAAGQEATSHVQSPEEAAAQDLALIAASRGWTIEQAQADQEAAEAVGRIAQQVAEGRPDIFIGSALSSDPGGAPMLYIKGPADDFVRNLVTDAGSQIQVVDNQPYSRAELDERQAQVVGALQELGFTNVGAGTDITNGQIEATVTRQAGLPDDPDEILAGLPSEVRDSVTLTVSDGPVACDD